MIKFLFTILFFTFLTGISFAQDTLKKVDPISSMDTTVTWVDTTKKVPAPEPVYPEMKHSVYLEAGGNGIWNSLNYEQLILLKKKDYFVFKFGGGYFANTDSSYMTFPITIGKLYRKKRYFVETGVGGVIIKTKKIIDWNLTMTLAYRRGIMQNRYYYKIAFTPYLDIKKIADVDFAIHPWIGLGIGKSF